jgi:parallel beta-helix repeat protein
LRKTLSSFIVVLTLVLTIFAAIDFGFDIVLEISGSTIYVGGAGPGNFSSIGQGINAAIPGDTVYVYNGTYFELITIDKTITLIGEDRDTTRIVNDISPTLTTVQVEAESVTITGFNISGGDPGIRITENHTHVWNNHIFDNAYGIYGILVYNQIITDNIFTSNEFAGVYLIGAQHVIQDNIFIDNVWGVEASDSSIINNEFYGNSGGIYVDAGYDNVITGNKIYNSNSAIAVSDASYDNYIAYNTIENSTNGIYVYDINTMGDTFRNDFIGNSINECDYGIRLGFEAGINQIEDNVISSNEYGIHIEMVYDSGNIVNNKISHNNYGIWALSWPHNINYNTLKNNNYGMYFGEGTQTHTIHHNNFIKNTNQAYDHANNFNIWDNGYPSGGNFWSDYPGPDVFSGPNQDQPGSDGIGDTPHVFDFAQDDYPLMDPSGNNLYLQKGWNLVSVPYSQPDEDIDEVLSSIDGSYKAVQGYDAVDTSDPWKHNHVNKVHSQNDLNTVDNSMGLWIFCNQTNGSLYTYPGTPPSSNQFISLKKGWNLVGYPSLTNRDRNDALNNLIHDIHVDAVWSYDSKSEVWNRMGESDYFLIGHGYWIHTTQDCTWEVPL